MTVRCRRVSKRNKVKDDQDQGYKVAFNNLVDRISDEFEEIAKAVEGKLQLADKRCHCIQYVDNSVCTLQP